MSHISGGAPPSFAISQKSIFECSGVFAKRWRLWGAPHNRHTFASWLAMEDISLYDVKELLGHATLAMTERYARLAPDRNKRAAKTMENVFNKKADADINIVNLG